MQTVAKICEWKSMVIYGLILDSWGLFDRASSSRNKQKYQLDATR